MTYRLIEDENCRVLREDRAQARRRFDAALDRQLAARSDALGDLYRRALAGIDRIKAEAKRHTVTVVKTYSDDRYRFARHTPACTCGWQGKPRPTKRDADAQAVDERDELRRFGRHTPCPRETFRFSF